MLEGLCGQIAIAIESTRLRQEMEARLRELSTLQRYMSREGWESYQMTKAHSVGYRFEHGSIEPIPVELLVQPSLTQPEKGGTIPLNGQHGKTKTVESTVNTPLTVRGEIIGALGVQEDPGRPLSPEERQFLTAASEQVAEALEAARLFEQTQDALAEQERLTAELETVAQVSTAAATILDVDTLLQSVVDLAKSSFGLYHAHIYLTNEKGDKLVLKAGASNIGRLMALEGRQIDINEVSLVARAGRTRQGVMENDVQKSVDFLSNPLLPHTRAEMAVPMIVGDKLVGILDLQASEVGFFTAEDLQIQKILAAQIAVAVQNAYLYAEQVETAVKLRQVDQLKTEFLASMSHELRTPLNSIIGFADVLLEGLDGELNERMEEDIRLIRESGRHLRELIGDILDMSKIEAGRVELRYEEIDLRQLANDIMAIANPLAQTKSLALYLQMEPDVKTVEADRTRLRQILWNIVGNAIKFTERGSVTLSMHVADDNLFVSVRDTGIGIKPEDMPIVFEQFRQVDGNLSRTVGGTGLGMPISKKLVELHGGEIWAESTPGKGSTFWFRLPCHRHSIGRSTAPLTTLDAR
jgi:signal transduction histidine kinase